jgi:hypothetical protein
MLNPALHASLLFGAIASLPLVGFVASETAVAADEVINIGSRRELFVDDLLIEKLDGAERRMHHPIPRDMRLTLDSAAKSTGASMAPPGA